MAPTVVLRDFHADDFESLLEIDEACYEPAIAYSRRELRNYLRFPGAQCVLAESGGRPIGFCITAHEGEFGYIVTMDVLAAHRRQGVATLILEEAERRMTANGVREVSLETATDDETAVAFWQKRGYRTRGLRKEYYPGGRDAFTMTKTINSLC